MQYAQLFLLDARHVHNPIQARFFPNSEQTKPQYDIEGDNTFHQAVVHRLNDVTTNIKGTECSKHYTNVYGLSCRSCMRFHKILSITVPQYLKNIHYHLSVYQYQLIFLLHIN